MGFFSVVLVKLVKVPNGKKIGTFQAKMTKNGPKISEKKNTICNDDFGQKCKNV